MENLIEQYKNKEKAIKSRISEFKALPESLYFKEFLFCLLTPQSKAKTCWEATELIYGKKLNQNEIADILKTRTRFHNNKSHYVLEAEKSWNIIKNKLNDFNVFELRNFIEANVKGYGLKEAAHFLRNIGKSNNKIAILDRHILRNMKALRVIENDKIKSKKDYFDKEKKFIEFSEKIGIPADELDLLFWSNENGEIFK